MTNEEALLIDIKFKLDMYGSGQGSAEATLASVREIVFSPSLTDDQQVVLEMLKEETIDRGNPYAGIYWLLANDEYPKISNKEFYQVLAAFAEWGSKEKQS